MWRPPTHSPGKSFPSKAGILFYLRKHVKESLFLAEVLFGVDVPTREKGKPSAEPRLWGLRFLLTDRIFLVSVNLRARIRRLSDSEYALAIDVLEAAR